MGKNKKEAFIFTLMMCFGMVLGMTTYNIILIEGFTTNVFPALIAGFLPGFIVALVLDIFVVGKFAKYMASKLVKDSDPMIKRILTISGFMICGMVIFMSFYGAFIHTGFSSALLPAYLNGMWKNFIMAVPLNLLIVSPIVRALFFKMFPPETAY